MGQEDGTSLTLPRGLFRFLLVILILIAVAFGGLWIRSIFVVDEFFYERSDVTSARFFYLYAEMASGRCIFKFALIHAPAPWDPRIKAGRDWYYDHSPNASRGFDAGSVPHFCGFGLDFQHDAGVNRRSKVLVNSYSGNGYVPLWGGIVPCLAIAGLSHFKLRRSRRKGFCRKCGYDLRATPQRCPECGMAATKPSKKIMGRT